MSSTKRYFWMKLKESFMTSDTVDYFMSQTDGANYVVLYQMLCLKTINTNGRMSRQIGEIIIPYDVEKIRRDMKWFSADTIRIALNLYKAVGLIYEEVDGTLVLADHANLVGSETNWAEKKRTQRALSAGMSTPEQGQYVDKQEDNVHPDVDKQEDNVHPDIRDRDKILEIRERDKILEIETETRNTGDAQPDSPPDAKKKKAPKPKEKYADSVHMHPEEHEKLCERYGEPFTWKCIERLDLYKGSKGKKYKDDYKAILSWVVDRVNEDNPGLMKRAPPQQEEGNPFAQFMRGDENER